MVRQQLILIPSTIMDGNKKEDRNEHGLVRMSKAARDFMQFGKTVELYPDSKSTEERLRGSVLLEIFHAFSEDIKNARQACSEDELSRVGFVTTKTFKRIVGKDSKNRHNIWITESVSDTVIGADPEFLLFNDAGAVVRANTVLGFNGAIGCDGAMAEIRPKPAISAEGLTENIRSIFAAAAKMKEINGYNWIAGCYFKDDNRDYPIGGHIHIGNPAKIAQLSVEQRQAFFQPFNKVLDELLSIPMIKIDGANLGKARRIECKMGKYGYFGEFRLCNARFQHRTLSGMWLMHPDLTEAVLGTAKAIIDEIYLHVSNARFDKEYLFPNEFKGRQLWRKDFTDWTKIPLTRDMNCVLTSEKMIELLHTSPSTKITAKFLSAWYGKMRKLSTYKVYAVYVDRLYEILKNKTETFHNYHRELKKGWLEGCKFLGGK